jgi:hypothetical protein
MGIPTLRESDMIAINLDICIFTSEKTPSFFGCSFVVDFTYPILGSRE